MNSGFTYINSTTTVLEQTLLEYSDLNYLFHFIGNNPQFNNIISDIPVNTYVITDDYKINISQSASATTINFNPNINVTVLENQSIFDILTRFYGDISNVINLMVANPQIDDINTNIIGYNLLVNTPNNLNNSVSYYNINNSVLATYQNKVIPVLTTGKSFNFSFSFAFH